MLKQSAGPKMSIYWPLLAQKPAVSAFVTLEKIYV